MSARTSVDGGLFPEPEPVDIWPSFPRDVVKDTALNAGLRYTFLGEDGQYLVFLGHPDTSRLVEVAREHCDVDTEWCYQPCRTGDKLCVDHDHTTGAVRGLLCRRCNAGLGYLEDAAWMAAAASFLATPPGIPRVCRPLLADTTTVNA